MTVIRYRVKPLKSCPVFGTTNEPLRDTDHRRPRVHVPFVEKVDVPGERARGQRTVFDIRRRPR